MWSGDASRWRQRGATTVISLSAGSLSWTRTHVTDHHGKRLASWKVLRTRPPRLALRSTSPDVGQPSSRAATAWFATTPLVSCTSSTLSSIVSTAVLARPPLPRGDIAFRALTSGDPGLPVLEQREGCWESDEKMQSKSWLLIRLATCAGTGAMSVSRTGCLSTGVRTPDTTTRAPRPTRPCSLAGVLHNGHSALSYTTPSSPRGYIPIGARTSQAPPRPRAHVIAPYSIWPGCKMPNVTSTLRLPPPPR
jgi:hypothetical protein